MGSKKEKKEKKEKKDKKSKHSKKDKKHKSDKNRGDSSNGATSEDELVCLLNVGILQQPKFMSNLCEIMKSLDDGEYVDVSNISNSTIRHFLLQLMKHLPVLYDHSSGWYKESQHTNVTSYVLKRLSECGAVRSPNVLSISEALSSKNVMLKLLDLLNSFPDLKGELGSLVGTLLDGNCVQLESLDNEDIRDGLEGLFKAIGLNNSMDGFSVPEGKKGKLVCEALIHIQHVFTLFESTVSAMQSREEVGTSSHTGGRKSSAGDVGSDSESSQSSKSSKSGQSSRSSTQNISHEGDHLNSDKSALLSAVSTSSEVSAVKGPSMPTLSDLQAARTLIEQQRRNGALNPADYEDSSDDDYGPQLLDPKTARAFQALQAAQPLGFAEAVDPSFARAFIEDEFGITSEGTSRREKYDGEAHQVVEADKREEWILTPGDSKAAASLTGAGLTNRKFNAGKQAKKLAEQMSIQREFQRQQQQLQLQQESAEQRKSTSCDFTGTGGAAAAGGGTAVRPVEEVMQDYRELRGGSLMEQHLANKKARTGEKDGAESAMLGKDGKPLRRAFDREKDMLSHSKMDEQKVAKLVQNAKELDDRFDKACVQKSFL